VFRASTKGASPGRFFLKDWALNIFGSVSEVCNLIGPWPDNITPQIALPIWRFVVDREINGHVTEHEAYLQERGL
jgi:hypothetical protein